VYLTAVCVISGFRREVYVNCALQSYYAAGSSNSLPLPAA